MRTVVGGRFPVPQVNEIVLPALEMVPSTQLPHPPPSPLPAVKTQLAGEAGRVKEIVPPWLFVHEEVMSF